MSNERKSNSIWELIKRLWIQYEELIRYIIVGGLTTGLNYAAYVLLFLLLQGVPGDYQIANAIAFVIAVIFAYFANKKAVFHTETRDARDAAREAGSFFLMRLLSYGMEAGLLELLVKGWGVHELIAKIPVGVLVVLLNYVFSKLFIFRKPKENKEEP